MTTALTVSSAPDTYEQNRGVRPKGSDHKVSLRWRMVIELRLAGHMPAKVLPGKDSIQNITGYGPQTICNILRTDEAVEVKQQLMKEYEVEFESLYAEVIEAVRLSLQSKSLADKREGAKIYLKEFGKGAQVQKGEGGINVTAEDVVFNILQIAEGRKVE